MLADGLAERLAARLARGRAAARARMGVENGASTCTIRRDAGLGTQREDGVQPRLWDVTHTDLPLRLAGPARGAAASSTMTTPSGDVEVPVRVASFPHDTTNLADGDLIEITGGENAGLVVRIVEGDWQDQSTAHRVPVIGARRPEEWDDAEEEES